MTNPLQEKIEEFKYKYLQFYVSGDVKDEEIEAWLTTTFEEVYKAGKEENDFEERRLLAEIDVKNYNEGWKKGEKNGLSRSVEAVKKLNTIGDGVDAWFKAEAIKAIESLN